MSVLVVCKHNFSVQFMLQVQPISANLWSYLAPFLTESVDDGGEGGDVTDGGRAGVEVRRTNCSVSLHICGLHSLALHSWSYLSLILCGIASILPLNAETEREGSLAKNKQAIASPCNCGLCSRQYWLVRDSAEIWWPSAKTIFLK